ncbi:hypothetical protein Q7C36_011205 [Tachysurus vachellii]|uniref:Uncharacterized protein n=1 Tax=Tachysurus vachellii TaxID=175792 RepID=A0AA88MQC5_TACVA|nr:hypothetical protein Q7C36_011205 [Tachysurus vachellii]
MASERISGEIGQADCAGEAEGRSDQRISRPPEHEKKDPQEPNQEPSLVHCVEKTQLFPQDALITEHCVRIDKSQDKQIGSGRVDVFVLRKAAPLICDERDDEEEQRYYSTNLPSQGCSTPPSSPLLLPIPLHLSAVTFNFLAVQLSSHLPLKLDELPTLTHSNANLHHAPHFIFRSRGSDFC